MTAALHISPALRLLPTTGPTGPDEPPRPTLRVLQGGRAPDRLARRAVYRRRRAVALGVLATVVVVLVLLVGAISARLAGGGHPSSAVGAPSPASAVALGAVEAAATQIHIVQPGETLWSIAASLTPDSDVRATVDRLVAANGDAPLMAGQRLVLP